MKQWIQDSVNVYKNILPHERLNVTDYIFIFYCNVMEIDRDWKALQIEIKEMSKFHTKLLKIF